MQTDVVLLLAKVINMAKLFTAQLDQWFINLYDINDSGTMALAQQEFVGTDGAYIQHMGNRARQISFKTFWFGSEPSFGHTFNPSYRSHFDFLNYINDSSLEHTLIHPKYGTISGYVSSYDVVHDDTQDYCVIDIKFVQKDIQTLGYISTDTLSDIESLSAKALNNALAKTGSDIAALGASSLLGKTIDFSQTIASQINNVSSNLRTFCNELDTNIDMFDHYLSDITTPLNSINNSVAFILDIPSRYVSSINNACDRIITSLDKFSNQPVVSINNLTLSLDNLFNNITGTNSTFFKTQFRSVSSIAVMNHMSKLLQQDEDNRNKSIMKEIKKAFDINGVRINTVTFNPYMTLGDLLNTQSLVRKYVQKAIILDRNNQDLKDMAASLIKYLNNVRLNRLQVKSININSTPIHMLLLQLGLPYQAADRILSINRDNVKPNYMQGNVSVYVK